MAGMFASMVLTFVGVLLAIAVVLGARPAADRLSRVLPRDRLPARLRSGAAPGLLLLVAGAALAAGLMAIFVEILDGVAENDDLAVADRPVVEWIAARRVGGASALVVALTDIGGKVLLGLLLAVAASAAALRIRSWYPIVLAAVAGGGGVLLVRGIKDLIGRDRPELPHRAIVEDGFSFPSGHSASTLIVLGTVAWLVSMVTRGRLVWATAWVAAGILTVAVGASRVYLGVHYPSDVLGGWVLGATWLVTVAVAARLPTSQVHALFDRWLAMGERRMPGWQRRPMVVFAAAAAAALATIFGIIAISAIMG